MNRFLRHIRLLPVVILVGFSLLTVKGFGLMHEARAEEAGASAPAEQPNPAAQLVNTADDPAADNEVASASEVDVLTSLTKRRKELDTREQKLAMRENVIAAAEQRVDNKITQLQALQAAIQKLLGQRDTEEQKQIASLVKTYSAMKPKDAARIFDTLDEDVRISVAQQMKPDVLAPVLAAMQSDQAQKLTLKLADRLKVKTPDVPLATPPGAPAPDGTPATATTPASTTSAPTTPAAQTAAATPPATTPLVQLASNEPPKAPTTPTSKPAPHRTPRHKPSTTSATPAKPVTAPAAATVASKPPVQTAAATTVPAAVSKPTTPQPAATPTPAPVQTAASKPVSAPATSVVPNTANVIKPAPAPATTTPSTASVTAPAAPVVAKPGG